MSVKERIKEYIKFEGITTVEFEKKINVGNGYINNISKGIGDDKIKMILENYPNLNFDWLFTGRGEMLRNSSKMDWECKVCAEKDKRIEDLKSHISVLQKLIATTECSVVGDNLGFINQSIKNEVIK